MAWNFSKVKKGQLDRYEIKKYEENVVQDSFKFGDDKEIVSFAFTLPSSRRLTFVPDRCTGQQCSQHQQEEPEAADATIPRWATSRDEKQHRQCAVLSWALEVMWADFLR